MPDNEDCKGHRHYLTIARAKIRGAVQFCERMGIDYVKKDVFQTFNVSTRQSHEFLQNDSFLHQLYNNFNRKKTRGRPRVISAEKFQEIERILQKKGIKARAMTQEQLGYEVRLECTGKTVKNAMGSMHYCKCVAYKKGWVNEKTARDWKSWVEVMKEKYSRPED